MPDSVLAYRELIRPAAVSCSATGHRLGGAGLGFWFTGKLGCAWVVHGMIHGCMVVVKLGWCGGGGENAVVYYTAADL